jgi:hypothetical protein
VRATAIGGCIRIARGAAMVRKLGDRFIVYDHENHVIGEADPGFRPTPEDAEWVEKVECAEAHAFTHPDYDWPFKAHAAWDG